jgi:hypothetical protein
MVSQAEAGTRIRVVMPIRDEAPPALVAHTLGAATAVADEATMAVAEEAITAGAVTAVITAGAASDQASDFTAPHTATVMVTLRGIAVRPDTMIAGATGFLPRVARRIPTKRAVRSQTAGTVADEQIDGARSNRQRYNLSKHCQVDFRPSALEQERIEDETECTSATGRSLPQSADKNNQAHRPTPSSGR